MAKEFNFVAFGEKLRELRKSVGLKRDPLLNQLAKIYFTIKPTEDFTVDAQLYSKWERAYVAKDGRKWRPTRDHVLTLITFFAEHLTLREAQNWAELVGYKFNESELQDAPFIEVDPYGDAHSVTAQILHHIESIDARLGIVRLSFDDDNFDQKLDGVRSNVAPAVQDIFRSAYQKLITTEQVNSLRHQLNSYSLPSSPEPFFFKLISSLGVDPTITQNFYHQLGQVQWATETLLGILLDRTKQDLKDEEQTMQQNNRLGIAINTLDNYTHLTHLFGLRILIHLPSTHTDATIQLASLANLSPREIVNIETWHNLYFELVQDFTASTCVRADHVDKAIDLRDLTLEEYKKINEMLNVNPADEQHVVIGKAISLRQLGRLEDAIGAFKKCGEMFEGSDPSIKKYVWTACNFTQQSSHLGITDGAVYIYDIVKKSNAKKAGLSIGDIIVEFDGREIRHINDIKEEFEKLPVNRNIELKYLRLTEENIFLCQRSIISGAETVGIYVMPI